MTARVATTGPSPGPSELWLDGRQPERVLTIDRGNSTLDCAITGGDEAHRRERVPPDAGAFARFLADERVALAAGVSVVAAGIDDVLAVCRARGVEVRVAGRELVCPLSLDYLRPERLGADRWVAAVAARARYGNAFIVDCGTAVTVDAVRSDGAFVSGAIAPGLRTLAAGLAIRAPALPTPSLDEPTSMPTHDSESAVRAGVQLGFAGLVESLVERLARALGLDAPVLITGGDAAVAARHAERVRYVPVSDLVHQGLRWLLQVSASKS